MRVHEFENIITAERRRRSEFPRHISGIHIGRELMAKRSREHRLWALNEIAWAPRGQGGTALGLVLQNHRGYMQAANSVRNLREENSFSV